MMTKPLLNFGCGTVFDSRWENIDLVPASSEVTACNILAGLPYPDDTFEMAYSSHVLEHLTPNQAKTLLREVYRVIKPGGLIRLAVPDVEGIVRAYLKEVDALRSGQGSADRHQWMTVELLDQMVRTEPGGSYPALVRNFPEKDLVFAQDRLGQAVIDAYRNTSAPSARANASKNWRARLKEWVNQRLGIDLDQARFRRSGEIHQWMYDEFNLGRLLESCGFVNPHRMTAWESAQADWKNYLLDQDERGGIRKPDSLFLEAAKPKS